VLGSYVVQLQRGSVLALVAGVPVGLLVAAILHANNLRDIPTDRAKGKYTLAARWGRRFAQREYLLLVGGAYLGLFAPAAYDPWLVLAALPPLLTLPAAVALVRAAYASADYLHLNQVLRGTATLHGRCGLLWATGIALVAGSRWLGWMP
jgi:1,4-dihydroxy-2-naphthoate polyprenyltransferase